MTGDGPPIATAAGREPASSVATQPLAVEEGQRSMAAQRMAAEPAGDGDMRSRADATPSRPPPPVSPPPPRTGSVQSAAAPASAVGSARSALELVGLVIAPTTLVTALAYYFGWKLTSARASYFGIDASALGFSTQDYLLRSADALFVPLGAAVALALGAVTLHATVRRDLHDGTRTALLRAIARVATIAGAALFALGVFTMFRPLPFSAPYLLAPASPGIGIIVLAYGRYLDARLRAGARPSSATQQARRGPRVDLALVCLLVVLSAFWTASVYADALGRGRAKLLAQHLPTRPQVTVFSAQRLHLASGDIAERELPGRDSAYRYRYSGLRLLVRSDDKYFLLPDGWSQGAGAAIVLADGAAVRFEFGSGR